MQGRFVVLEGIDGAGTTTQVERLAVGLRAQGVGVHATREPTAGAIGVLLRKILTGAHVPSAGSEVQHAAQLGLLFAADRLDHLDREVLPRLARGEWVVSDRYDFSSIAYQSVTSKGQVSIGWLRALNRFARRPDLTVVLDVSADVARARRNARNQARELFDDDDLQRELATFYAGVEQHFDGERIVHIDADRGVDEVARDVLAAASGAALGRSGPR
jgi:dTMP kinase